jgi:PAS domain S-box-containing protein
VNRDLARTLLSRKGYTILEASGGAEGLRTAIRARPDVVVTDVLMPDMDGYQLVGELRARPELAHTPVIFYTSNYLESQARPLAEACGVSQIVVRSEDPVRLIEAVGAALEREPPDGISPLPVNFDRHHAQVINNALLAKIRELQVSEKRFRVIAEASPVGIILTDPDAAAVYVSPECARLLDQPAAELAGRQWLSFVNAGHRAVLLAQLRDRHREPLPLRVRLATRAGCNLWVDAHVRSIHDAGDQLTGGLVLLADATGQVEAEERIGSLNASLVQQVQEVKEHSIRLERANKDLEGFAHSVAHDLRTPLRGISGFAEALAEDYGDRLDETGREYAGRVQAGCERMATLLDDLLNLSQVTQAKMSLEDVDLSAEVTVICDQLRARDPGRQVQVRVQEGVRVTADRALIRSALHNLLGNAWKFTSRRDDAAIEFATAPVGDAPICCYVRDNGAGFDSAYVGMLFQPFQRLHHADEFPGTGIGLATVRRIIDRHGGRTWAEGTVDGGATIYFTLDTKGTPQLTARSPSSRTTQTTGTSPSGAQKSSIVKPVVVASNAAEALTLLLGDDHRD